MSSLLPDVTVEVAFNAGYTTPAASRTWTDVSAYAEAQAGLSISRGRQDELDQIQPSRLTLTLDNRDGRFTPGNTAGAYYPNVKKGRPIRVRTRPTYPAAVLTSKPVGYWRLGEASGTTAVDSSGNGRNGGHFGSPGPTLGQAGALVSDTNTAYGFDGAAESGHVITTNFPSSAAAFAVEAWVYLNAAGAVTQALAEKAVGESTNTDWLLYVDTGTGRFTWRVVDDSAALVTIAAASDATRDTWHHVVGTLSGNVMRLYVDNVEVASAAVTRTAAKAAGNLWFARLVSAPEYKLNGRLDEVAVYDRALTATEISDHYKAGIGTVYDRFTGYVDEWPVEWPTGTDNFATSQIVCSSRMARLGKAAELRSIIEEEYLQDTPAAYYPLGEPDGATAAGNIATARREPLVVQQAGTGGTLEFGAGTGPGTDGMGAPIFTRVDTLNGKYLQAVLPVPLTVAGDKWVELEVFVATTGTRMALVTLYLTKNDYLMLNIHGTGGTQGWVVTSNGAGSYNYSSVSSNTVVNDGKTHHLVLKVDRSMTNDAVPSIIVDGVTTTASDGGVTLRDFPPYTHLVVGGPKDITNNLTNLFDGTLAHAAVYVQASTAVTDARFVVHKDAGVTGFSGESSDARVQRIVRWAGMPAAEVSVETGLSTSIAHRDSTGQTPVALMQEVATTEGGLLFDGRGGVLTFHARSHRYGAVSAFTVDATKHEVGSGLAPIFDDQGVVNDATATREGGVEGRATVVASVSEYGRYHQSLSLVTTSDTEVQSRADWQVNRYAEPRTRIPSVSVDVANSAQAAALLAADLGTRFTITGLPAQAPSASMDLFVEGYTETIDHASYTITFNTSEALLSAAWQLDSAISSQLDSSTVLAY